jgi:hypothetical protein
VPRHPLSPDYRHWIQKIFENDTGKEEGTAAKEEGNETVDIGFDVGAFE